MPPFPNMTFDLDLWPTDMKINRDHLLINDYLPTKFEASGAKPSWVISCPRLRETDIPTDRRTDMCNAICPFFFKGGIDIRRGTVQTIFWIKIYIIGCILGTYGPECQNICEKCTGNVVCNFITGECNACNDGFYGQGCDKGRAYWF